MAPINIDGSPVQDITIDGQPVTEVTVDGDVVFPAIPDSVIDNFEETIYGDQNKTLSDIYGGDIESYSRQPTVVADGNQALEGTSSGIISSTSGLNRYPDRGTKFAYNVRATSDRFSASLIFGTQNETATPAGYSVEINWGNSAVRIGVLDGSGNINIISTGSNDYVTDEWYRVEIDWATDGTITVTVFNSTDTQVDSASATDTSYIGGGIGWRQFADASGGPFYLDNARLL